VEKGLSDPGNTNDFMAPKSPAFHKSIISGDFFTINDEEILRQVHEEFTDELERLKRAYSIRDTDATLPTTKSPSQILYGTNFDEVNRTLVGVLALRWIYTGDYGAFVGSQPATVKLKRESFEWMQKVFSEGIKTSTDLYSLVLSMVINDLGKDPKLAEDYCERTGEDVSAGNHDMILLKAVKVGMVPCLDRLNRSHKADIVRGMELGAEFNFGQLAQAENMPACVSGLLDMRGHVRPFEMRFMEQLLDIAGAAGHMDWTCAKKLIEPIYQSYHNVYDVATGIISGRLGLRDGYDIILIRRGELLEKTGFRSLSVQKPEERALMRLLCMGGVANLETAELYDDAFFTLDAKTLETLVPKLNIDGSVAQPAIQPTYMPAMLARGINNTPIGSFEERKRALQSLLRYLARVLTVTKKPKEPISVIERNVILALKDVLGGEKFKVNPDVLENVAVPKDEVAKMGVAGD
jgi:hypothetical protein